MEHDRDSLSISVGEIECLFEQIHFLYPSETSIHFKAQHNLADFSLFGEILRPSACTFPPLTWASMTSTGQEPPEDLLSIRTSGIRTGTGAGISRDSHRERSLRACQGCQGKTTEHYRDVNERYAEVSEPFLQWLFYPRQ